MTDHEQTGKPRRRGDYDYAQHGAVRRRRRDSISVNAEWRQLPEIKDREWKIAVRPWIVTLAGGGLPAIIANQADYWFSRCVPLPPKLLGKSWLTTYSHLAKEIGVEPDRNSHRIIKRDLHRLQNKGLLKVQTTGGGIGFYRFNDILVSKHSCTGTGKGCAVCLLLGSDPRSWLAIHNTGIFAPVSVANPNVANTFPVEAVGKYGANPAIVLQWLLYRTQRKYGEPVVETLRSIARRTGLTYYQACRAADKLIAMDAVRVTPTTDGTRDAANRWTVNPWAFQQFEVTVKKKPKSAKRRQAQRAGW